MLVGVDIGGTKCAVTLADEKGTVIKKVRFKTEDCRRTTERITELAAEFSKGGRPDAVGISCGGPLDSKRGIILSPPNLPGWDNVNITQMLQTATGAPAFLCNDANACALAEWKYGAGKGTRNMIFLTFGTGMGAGLILDGRLYEGKCGMAGEAGHIRLCTKGPPGYGKRGSFEGFCSGGGIAELGKSLVRAEYKDGGTVGFCTEDEIPLLDAKKIAEAAYGGNALALKIYDISAQRLGSALSILMDILNPELIVIGSIFARCESLFREKMEEVIKREALPQCRSVCKVVPSQLGESIGDLAALAVASAGLEERKNV